MKYKNIFLVDDEDFINAIQTRIVKSEFPECHIQRFSNAQEVLNTLTKIDYDPLIFLDLNMPEMDAIDFLLKLETKQNESKPFIVILTFSQNEVEIEFVKTTLWLKKFY